MLWAEPIAWRPARPCRISSRTSAIGSRADRPPPSATRAPSATRPAASGRVTSLLGDRWAGTAASSLGGHAAVRSDDGAGEERGVVAGQEDRGGGDLLRGAKAPERVLDHRGRQA